jgi:protein-tyrosine phosphatase
MQSWQPNLSWLTSHLAIGGSFPADRVDQLADVLHIRAVVDMRVEACDDETVLERHGLTFLHLPTQDHCAVSEPMLWDGVTFINRHLDRGERVLVHCEHGIGRSATLALCVLVSRGMEPLQALALAKCRRSLVSPSPAQYEAWVQWLRTCKTRKQLAWSIPPFDAFKAIAYRHLPAEST